jgi:hypothetical protein
MTSVLSLGSVQREVDDAIVHLFPAGTDTDTDAAPRAESGSPATPAADAGPPRRRPGKAAAGG